MPTMRETLRQCAHFFDCYGNSKEAAALRTLATRMDEEGARARDRLSAGSKWLDRNEISRADATIAALDRLDAPVEP